VSAIKAIETYYKGCHFRSRLEARWAVFFDALGVEWSYEPEGFEWPARPADPDDDDGPFGYGLPELFGGYYLPDFWLPSINTWFEVKGPEPDAEEWRILSEFRWTADGRLVVAVGDIPYNTDLSGYPPAFSSANSLGLQTTDDYNYAWCSCPRCGKFGIEYEARGGRVCGQRCGRPADADDKAYSGNNPQILWAYDEARSARFEHGQSGRRR